MADVIATAAYKDWQSLAFSRKIAELLRVFLQRHTHPVDDEALRDLMDPTNGEPLVVLPPGAFFPVVTTEGARVCAELIAVWENQA